MEEDEHLYGSYGVADDELPNGAHGRHEGKLATTVDNEDQLEALMAMKEDGNLLSFALSCKAEHGKMTDSQLRGVLATMSECNLRRFVLGMIEKDANGDDKIRFDLDKYATDDTLLYAGKVAYPRQLAFQHRGKTPNAEFFFEFLRCPTMYVAPEGGLINRTIPSEHRSPEYFT